MTIAEKLREKGMQEGERKGEQKGLEKAALMMLREGVEMAFIAKVTNLSAVDIERLRTLLTDSDWQCHISENEHEVNYLHSFY